MDSYFLSEILGDGRARVAMVSFQGSRLWSFDLLHQPTGLADEGPPGPVAAGDFTGDSIPDYVFTARAKIQPETRCGPYLQTWSQLVFVNGRTGGTTTALPPIDNICHDFPAAGVTYPTHRWSGYVQIGEFSPSYRGNEVVALPNYPPEHRGWVLNFQQNGAWSKVIGRDGADSFVFPSHPDFATYYNAANPLAPCQPIWSYPTCTMPNSHVPTGLLFGSAVGGAFMLTTGRALVYRSDLTPTSDTIWKSGTTVNGGRNYGSAVAYSHGGKQYASLVGGCSVSSARKAMQTGQLPTGQQATSLGGVDAHCGIHHHYESFVVQGTTITQHFNEYYSYSVDDGFFHGRPEFPGNTVGPVGGPGTMWTVYNLFNAPKGSQGAGQWEIVLRPNPSDPRAVVRKLGWFVWDVADLNADGRAEVLATRADPRSTTPYVLPWEFDVLVWNGSDLQTVYHRAGVVPSLFKYPRDAKHYVTGGAREGMLTGEVNKEGVKTVMVENRDARRSFLEVPARALAR
jgi:hypothetical protein